MCFFSFLSPIAKTDVKEANEGLEECIITKFKAMGDSRLKVS